jgi:hypothetical protein
MRSLFICIMLFFAGAVQAQTVQEDWRLLIPGTYHDGEAPKKPGIGWLALVSVGGVWRLEPAIVRSTRVHDNVVDGDTEKTGIEISSSYGDAIALLRISGVMPGKVDTPTMKFKGNPRYLSQKDAPLKILFKGQEYAIEANASGVYLRRGAELTLLPDITAGGPESDDSASLQWAGDLDGDGKLDFLLAYGHSNSGGTCLFLSGNTSGGALVQKVACHGGIGC